MYFPYTLQRVVSIITLNASVLRVIALPNSQDNAIAASWSSISSVLASPTNIPAGRAALADYADLLRAVRPLQSRRRWTRPSHFYQSWATQSVP
jgi:hypothetical protein